ncbi:MAG TPA: 5-formyltetrahydrofolate cyclo-ligase [Rhodoblastus sp.]|nr:5-formyltetrahydrofolate cyclo-ligase [Rhodoblastus sp.]
MAHNLTQEKARLRAQFSAARAALSPGDAVAAAEKCAARALAFVLEKAPRPAQTRAPVALYAALPGELDCFPLLAALAERRFPTLLPIAGAKATPLTFRLWKPGDALAQGRFGLREPLETAPAMRPRILFAPLLAFDRAGTRLGFGGGYYDATLAALRGQKSVLAGGLAFSCQEAAKIPREAHDGKLDFVITEKELLLFMEPTCASSSSAT